MKNQKLKELKYGSSVQNGYLTFQLGIKIKFYVII